MFSGYVGDCGSIKKVEKMPHGIRWHITAAYDDLEKGESVAVDGVCLTVTDILEGCFACDLSPETLNCTRAKYLSVGDRVNLERSIRLQDRLNGHLVMGHIDQTCVLKAKEQLSDYLSLCFSGVQSDSQAYIVPKGSIAINGVSLTLNSVLGDSFEVMLIPETLTKTNLSNLSINGCVNVEYDYLAKLAAKQMLVYSKP